MITIMITKNYFRKYDEWWHDRMLSDGRQKVSKARYSVTEVSIPIDTVVGIKILKLFVRNFTFQHCYRVTVKTKTFWKKFDYERLNV